MSVGSASEHSTAWVGVYGSNTGAVVSSMVKVADTLLLLPQSSVAVKVTVAEPVAPQSSLNATKLLLQVTPLQISEAVAPPLLFNHAFRASALPAPSHSTVSSEAAVISGLVVSSIVNVAEEELLFPQSSVAVKVTVAEPVAPQSSLKPSKSLLQVTPPQISEAVAPPLLFNHAFKAAVLPAPSHSTVSSEAAVISGLVVSSIVNVAVVELLLSQSSVTVNVTVTVPVAPQSSLKPSKSLLHSMLLQLSVAEAPPLLSNHAFRASRFPAPSHSTVWFDAIGSITGATASINVMICSAVLVLPQSSVAVYVRR